MRIIEATMHCCWSWRHISAGKYRVCVDNYNTVYLTHQYFVLFSSLGSIYLLIYIACINPRATRCHSSHCRHQWTSLCQATQIKICSLSSWNHCRAKQQYICSVTWQLARWSRCMLFDVYVNGLMQLSSVPSFPLARVYVSSMALSARTGKLFNSMAVS